MAIIFSDTFTGTNGAAWPSAWTTSGTTGSTQTIQNNQGQLALGTLGGFADISRAILTQAGTTALTDCEVLLSVTFGTFPPTYGLAVFARTDGAWTNNDNPGTWIKAELDTDGSASIAYRLSSGTITTPASAAGGTFAITANQPWFMRFRVTGTSAAVKFWKNDGTTPEPSNWSLTATQSVVNTSGPIMMRSLGGSTATSAMLIDNFSLDNTIGSGGAGWHARGGIRNHLAQRSFSHKRASF